MMKMTKKQKDFYLKIAAVVAIGAVAYLVFKNMREVVSDKVAKRVSKDMAKETVSQTKGMKRQR